MYVALTNTVGGKRKLIPVSANIWDNIDEKSDWYASIFQYNEEQKRLIQDTGSVAGIKDVTTNKLVWDFDCKDDLGRAKEDTIILYNRLLGYGVNSSSIVLAFSGNKGYSLEVFCKETLTVDQFKAITGTLAGDLPTADPSVSDHARIFRITGTKHNVSGLYKSPLTIKQLKEYTPEQVKEYSKDNSKWQSSEYSYSNLPNELLKFKDRKPVEVIKSIEGISSLDFRSKPKGFPNCRYAIMQGYFETGERSNSLLALAATCKNQGFSKNTSYYICKGATKAQADRTGEDKFPKEELWNNIIEQVYSTKWNGGQYSCRSDDPKNAFLKHICESLGPNKCRHTEETFTSIEMFHDKFKKFAVDIEKNTLKLGIEQVDKKVMLTTSMLVGLLGAPSSGKTNLLLNFLNHSSNNNIKSLFFSMDMGLPLVYLRLIQKHFGYKKEQIFEFYRSNPKKILEINERIKQEYNKVSFSFKSGLNVEDIRNSITDAQDKTGEKVKLVGVDYLECISGPYSDINANISIIANQLKDIANDCEVCVMLLLQPQKHAGDPSDAIVSMRSVKGSSVIEQACSVIMSLHRPGFSPVYPEDDLFVTINTVKDRMNSLMSVSCLWDGLTGGISELPQEKEILLEEVIQRKKQENSSKESYGF